MFPPFPSNFLASGLELAFGVMGRDEGPKLQVLTRSYYRGIGSWDYLKEVFGGQTWEETRKEWYRATAGKQI